MADSPAGTPSRPVRVGIRGFSVTVVSPDTPGLGDFTRLLNLLDRQLAENCLSVLDRELAEFGGVNDDIETARKYEVDALAASLPGCIVVALESPATPIRREAR